jgi:integrase
MAPMKKEQTLTATRQRIRVAPNLRRDPATGSYYGFKKIGRRRFRHSLKTSDRATANRKLTEWLRNLNAADPTAADIKLEALLQNFLSSRAAKGKRTRETEESIARVLRGTFQPGMTLPVRRIKTSDLLKWLNTEAAARRWRNRTFNRQRLFLRQLFDLALADGVVTEQSNPFKAKLIRPKKAEKVIRNIPTLTQFDAIIENVRSQRDNSQREQSADFLAFLGLAGVGQAEAIDLKWRDIDADKIRLIRRKTGAQFTVPIYVWLAPLVQRLRSARKGVDGNEKVFSIGNAKRALRNACIRLKLPQFTQRNLRAMCIKRLYDAEVPVKRIALWQGHSDGGKLIQQIYTEVFCDTDAVAEAADLALVTSAEKVVKFSTVA